MITSRSKWRPANRSFMPLNSFIVGPFLPNHYCNPLALAICTRAAALSYPLGIHCLPAHEARPDSVTRGWLAIPSDFELDCGPGRVGRGPYTQYRFSHRGPLEGSVIDNRCWAEHQGA